jgi:hypothetical protein
MKLVKTALFVSAWASTLMFVAPALADSPTQSAYGCQGCSTIDGGSSSLPFTGLNVALIVLFGVLLLGAGLAVRRSTRTRAD